MEKLTNKEQIKILMNCKRYVKFGYGLCLSITLSCLNLYGLSLDDIDNIIPLFTYENAKIACEERNVKIPTGRIDWFWWDKNEINSRLEFVHWMIGKLEKE